MASSKHISHNALPAPSVHAGFSIHQSKSHVLAGVQDAYWNDEEAEDAECPLCLEEMDISDLNFKPCVCGYQICRFCWHHIKENLNKRCPACRRQYTDETVEFIPISPQDHKRLTQQKKQKERERKELDALGRRHLANVRVVQRNVVYVVGIGSRFAKDELIPTLRSNEYFGQYGRITKCVLAKRAPSGSVAPVTGLYITYYKREDAARAIAAVDGAPSPSGGHEVMRGSYGTTKYCMAFLRGTACTDHSCMNLHEWGDEKDCFTKEDLTTLKHTMKTTENRSRGLLLSKKGDESDGLPRSAAWGYKTGISTPSSTGASGTTLSMMSLPASQRSNRRGGARQTRPVTNESRASSSRTLDRKVTKNASQSSRPSTPSLTANPPTPAESRTRHKKASVPSPISPSPAPSVQAGSDQGSQSGTPDSPSEPPQVLADTAPVPSAPPGLSTVPPGLATPPGLPSPARPPPRADTVSPQTPLLSFQTTYQMSSAAQALLDDVKARREVATSSFVSPFPDFDRTLQNLSGGDEGFSFNLDPKLTDEGDETQLPDFEAEAQAPFIGSYVDAFPALRQDASGSFMSPPPGLAYPHNPSRSIYDPLSVRSPSTPAVEVQTTGGSSSYVGAFNPFAEVNEERTSQFLSPSKVAFDDDGRKVSRFGFARGRQTSTATSSPLHAPSPLSVNNSLTEGHSFYNSADPPQSPAPSQWSLHSRPEYHYQPPSNMASPMLHHVQAQPYSPSPSRYQPYNDHTLNDHTLSEAQLRDFIQSSRERVGSGMRNNSAEQAQPTINSAPPFADPAIMSARFASASDNGFAQMDHAHVNYGPPPGLVYPQSSGMSVLESNGPVNVINATTAQYLPVLSSSDFPALSTTTSGSDAPASGSEVNSKEGQDAPDKAARKAEKRAAAVQKAAERQRLAQERAAIKAAHRIRLAEEKAADKERLATLKAAEDNEKAERAALEKERMTAIKEKERAAKEEREAMEKQKAIQAEQEQAARVAAREANLAKAKRREEVAAQSKITPKQTLAHFSPSEAIDQVPLLSKKPKKNKPVAKIRVSTKDDHDQVAEEHSATFSATLSDASILPTGKTSSLNVSVDTSRSQSRDRNGPTYLANLLQDIHELNPQMDVPNHPLFNPQKINSAAKMPLEYGPLVHALSALSVGGGTFTNTVPSGSIDNAVSSFQQLLETLTQTISDLLRLLPRTTWDDSSSFDGVLRDMLKGDDFLDDGATTDDGGHAKDDDVAALTLALERRARWMEVQLSKLEELHRDINTAAVRAVLAFNDAGWDRQGFLPRSGTSLSRFDNLGFVEDDGEVRPMTADELEEKFAVAEEAAVFAETEVREMMETMQSIRPVA